MICIFGLGAPSKFSPSILGSGVGGHAVRLASADGLSVRAVARNPSKYESFYKDLPNVTLVKGDVTNPTSISECIKDCTAAIFAVQATDDVTAMEIDRDGLINVANECLKANCKLILISSVYVTPKHRFNPIRGFLNVFVKWNMMDAKWQSEEAMRKMKGLKYTIIRPGSLTDKEGGRTEIKVGQGDTFLFPIVPITKQDAARIAIAAAKDSTSDSVTCEIAGSKVVVDKQNFEGFFNNLKKDS